MTSEATTWGVGIETSWQKKGETWGRQGIRGDPVTMNLNFEHPLRTERRGAFTLDGAPYRIYDETDWNRD